MHTQLSTRTSTLMAVRRTRARRNTAIVWVVVAIAVGVAAFAANSVLKRSGSSAEPATDGSSYSRSIVAPPSPAKEPSPYEWVRMREQWHKAFEGLFAQLMDHEEQLRTKLEEGIPREDAYQLKSEAYCLAGKAGFRTEYDRLYASLHSPWVSIPQEYDARQVERLEKRLELGKAELRRAIELMDQEYQLAMDLRRKSGK